MRFSRTSIDFAAGSIALACGSLLTPTPAHAVYLTAGRTKV